METSFKMFRAGAGEERAPQPPRGLSAPKTSRDDDVSKAQGVNRNLPQGPKMPAISLPKGGGAIRGLGEKFSVNPVTGTATAQVPIPVTPGRDGHGPTSLSISYASDSGNGPWGIGWKLGFGSISRKTDKGLPRYDNSDIFNFEGQEDLVPAFKKNTADGTLVEDGSGHFSLHVEQRDDWTVQRFRPRIESGFTRIEKWTSNLNPGEEHWRTTDATGAVTLYGLTDDSRIFDTESTGMNKRIFSWQICQTYDTKGNSTLYQYKREDSKGIDLRSPSEVNRSAEARSANLYLKSIKYGNRKPNRHLQSWVAFDANQLPTDTWMFEVVLDYGEHDLVNPKLSEKGIWPCRKDPFSIYRSSFEVRTYRLCRRVLVFHHFPEELGTKDYLVSSTTFFYDENPVASYMTGALRSGHMTDPGGGPTLTQNLPPLNFEYSTLPALNDLDQFPIQSLGEESTEGLPSGFSGAYQPIDLNGEGLVGVIFESGGTWFYKRNVSANNMVPRRAGSASSGNPTALFRRPVAVNVAPNRSLDDSFQLLALTGGRIDAVDLEPGRAGYYERCIKTIQNPTGGFCTTESWEPFRYLPSFPNIDINDANAKLIDTTGDGLADILISEDGRFILYQSLGKEGFATGTIIAQSMNEDRGPRILFSDSEHTMFLADMSGDGLPDLVRISSPGSVCYWPSLGYGNFGAKRLMGNCPTLDSPGQFDATRIRLADVDGNGTSDIVYLACDHILICRNCSGNQWLDRQVISQVPIYDNLTSVQTMDLLGRGTGCLVWSSGKPADARVPVKYVDLVNGTKPHLLVRAWNNMGAETKYTYTPSTQFYLDDEAAGKPWHTHIPFPVHCVSRIETHDYIGRSRFVTRYAYHHGYYDGIEREFRGFASAEHWDTEEFASLDGGALDDVVNWDAAFVSPPVHTKQYYHTGAYFDAGELGHLLAQEYFGTPSTFDEAAFAGFIQSQNLGTVLRGGLAADDLREAYRALKGLMLREEIYTEDGTLRSKIPHSVTSNSYSLTCLQPKDMNNQHSVWHSQPLETMKFRYERKSEDPRISHILNLKRDGFGNLLKSLMICYGIRNSSLNGAAKAIQEETLMTYSEQDYTNFIDNSTAYVLPHPAENRVYEITGVRPLPCNQYFCVSDFSRDDFQPLRELREVSYETEKTASSRWKRLAHKSRVYYRSDDLSRILPLGKVENMTHAGCSYAMAFTPGLVSKFTGSNFTLIPNAIDTFTQGGYIDLDKDSNWWVPSGRSYFHPSAEACSQQELAEARAHFFYGRRYADVFGNSTTLYQDKHDILPVLTIDAIGNEVLASNDYRTMQPYLAVDINGNRTQVSFDALGKVVGSALMGKESEALGDSLESFASYVSAADLVEFFTNPIGDVTRRLLGTASSRTIYDPEQYHRAPRKCLPMWSALISRERHVSDVGLPKTPRIRVNFSYSDGFGREVQQKNLQEPGPIEENGLPVDPRWVATGWTIFNNKGKEVQRFEDFFDDTHGFKFLHCEGVSPIILYDAAERAAVTLRPDHSWSKTLFTSWEEVTYDAGDLTLTSDPRNDPDVGELFQKLGTDYYLPSWYDQRQSGQLGRFEQEAATKSSAYNNTPSIRHGDALGRGFYTMTDNGTHGKIITWSILDVEGHKLQTIDALGRIVDKSDYNMLGSAYHRISMDTGESWALNDAADCTFLNWNERRQRLHTTYDQLRRVTSHILLDLTSLTGGVVDSIIYGDEIRGGQNRNLRGRHYKQYDQSGVLTLPLYDFKGNLLRQEQQLAKNYKTTIDWRILEDVPLEEEIYVSEARYDALNRHIQGTTPDNTVSANVYNEASYVERVQVNMRGEKDSNGNPIFEEYVTHVDYDAQGRRSSIQYGNGVETTYSYDRLSSEFVTLRSKGPRRIIQDFTYIYDIMGNVTHVVDRAQQSAFFRNQVVEPGTDYTYDPVGRLVESRGRERLSAEVSNNILGPADAATSALPLLAENALALYTETYVYDAANNILQLSHRGSQAANSGWTRKYSYEIPSHIKPSEMSNKLTATTTGLVTEKYLYEGLEGSAGLMTAMSHLSSMKWDFRDNLAAVSAQDVKDGSPETTYYVYDAAGQRTRKVTDRSRNGTEPARKLKETVYVTGVEAYRKYLGDGSTIKLERQTFKAVHSDKIVALVEDRTKFVLDRTTDAGNGGRKSMTPAGEKRLHRYQLDNYLGSICVELDMHGSVISYEEYSAYGSSTYRALRVDVDADKRYRFANKERDTETGLYANGARYYAPWLGRWVSADPAGLAGDGLNGFVYAKCCPARYQDPGGAESEDWRNSLGWIQRAALKVDDFINDRPVVRGITDSLHRRGEALMNTPKALMELAQKPPLEMAETVGAGLAELGKETVEAGRNVAVYAYKAIAEGGDENWRKLGDASTNLSLNTADVVTTLAGGAGAVKSLKNIGTANRVLNAGGKAAYESAKATVKEMPAVIQEAAATASKTALVPTFEGGITGADLLTHLGKAANVMMAVSNKVGEGVKKAVAAGAKASGQAKGLRAAIKYLEEGMTPIARDYRAFKSGKKNLPAAKDVTMAEAVEERLKMGTLEEPHATRRHHDMPRTLQPLWDAFDIKFHWTIETDLVEHQIIHGTGGFFVDSNVLWAHKLSEAKDLWKLNADTLETMRKEINSTYGYIPSVGNSLNDAQRVWWYAPRGS
ncbi:SpvB domain-containing protein [Trichoderma evansii]